MTFVIIPFCHEKCQRIRLEMYSFKANTRSEKNTKLPQVDRGHEFLVKYLFDSLLSCLAL